MRFMALGDMLKRLRGALGNALVWGVGWLTVGVVVLTTLRVVGVLTFPWVDLVAFAVRMGIVGAVAGGAFSVAIGLLYHGRRLSEISWVRFGIGGGLVTGMFVPLFLQTMNLLSGDGLVPWELVLDDGLWTAVFGGVMAGGSLKLAQLGDTLLPGGTQDQLDHPEEMDRLASAGEQDPR
jgi:hypothetical protein